MGVEKDNERGTYTVRVRYKDFNGENKVHKKRGFKLKREAKEYETEFLRKLGSTTNMDFTSFVDIYKRDVWPMIKHSTQKNRECVIETKILPFFGGVKVQDIKPRHSFVRMQRLPDVAGKIDYISSLDRQEYLYSVYRTCDDGF